MPNLFCHPERSEGSAFKNSKHEILHFVQYDNKSFGQNLFKASRPWRN